MAKGFEDIYSKEDNHSSMNTLKDSQPLQSLEKCIVKEYEISLQTHWNVTIQTSTEITSVAWMWEKLESPDPNDKTAKLCSYMPSVHTVQLENCKQCPHKNGN